MDRFDRTTKLWDTETGKCVHTFITGKLPYVAKFCPDPAHGNDILVGQNDKKIIQWDTNTAQITQEYDQVCRVQGFGCCTQSCL